MALDFVIVIEITFLISRNAKLPNQNSYDTRNKNEDNKDHFAFRVAKFFLHVIQPSRRAHVAQL